jgi:hypothetical protein
MTLDDEFWLDSFHFCALYAAKLAHAEGRLEDSEYVRQLTYRLYEEGAFREERPGAERGLS